MGVRAHAAALSPPALVFTWLGALLFFFSLAYFLFSYVTTFGEAASGGGIGVPITWNVALFTVFALHHSVFARERVRAAIAHTLPQPLERAWPESSATRRIHAAPRNREPVRHRR